MKELQMHERMGTFRQTVCLGLLLEFTGTSASISALPGSS